MFAQLHAFAAPGSTAELLIVITPGVERFEYFRHLGRIAKGEQRAESLLDEQDRCDTHFLVGPTVAGRSRPLGAPWPCLAASN